MSHLIAYIPIDAPNQMFTRNAFNPELLNYSILFVNPFHTLHIKLISCCILQPLDTLYYSHVKLSQLKVGMEKISFFHLRFRVLHHAHTCSNIDDKFYLNGLQPRRFNLKSLYIGRYRHTA